jgi:hypothetical protein
MRKPRRKGKPNDLKTVVHDRRATEPKRNAMLSPIQVDDPMALDPGDKIVVMRNLRGDPLGAMHARRQITDEQFQAGRSFQADFEAAERGPRAIDPGKEYVDGGELPEPISEGQRKAVMRLNRASRELGLDGAALTHDVLIGRLPVSQLCIRRGLTGERWENYFSRRLRECLDRLARMYGFAS